MKTFTEFDKEIRHKKLLEEKINDSPEVIRKFHEELNAIEEKFGLNYSWDNSLLYSFENFCEDNSVDINNQAIYDNALDFFDKFHWRSTNLNVFTDYDYHQDEFYETLNYSMNIDIVERYAKKVFGDNVKVSYDERTLRTSSNKKHIKIMSNEILDEKDLNSILNFVNYSVIETYESNNAYIYVIKPNISEDASDKIHNQKFLYHVTSKQVLNKILKFGLHPHSKTGNDWTKIFVFSNQINVSQKIKTFWNLQSRLRKYDLPDMIKDEIDLTPILLKIDVSSLPKEMKFFVDDNYIGTSAYYTFEPISPKAIIDYIELNDNNIENFIE